jgi:hypothetical protein
VVGPQAKREAVKIFCTAVDCSERHACGRLEVLRAMVRYRPRQSRYAGCACAFGNLLKSGADGDTAGCTSCWNGKAGK